MIDRHVAERQKMIYVCTKLPCLCISKGFHQPQLNSMRPTLEPGPNSFSATLPHFPETLPVYRPSFFSPLFPFYRKVLLDSPIMNPSLLSGNIYISSPRYINVLLRFLALPIKHPMRKEQILSKEVLGKIIEFHILGAEAIGSGNSRHAREFVHVY